MLTALHLGNFKAFADTQRIPIKPLTLIFGPNSSGKSSIIHGLLLAKEAIEHGTLDVHRTECGGDSVDLGGFRNFVHKHLLESTVCLSLASSRDPKTRCDAFSGGPLAEMTSFGLSAYVGFITDDIGRPEAGPFLTRYEGHIDGELAFRLSRRGPGPLALDLLNYKNQSIRRIVAGVVESQMLTEKEVTASDLEVVTKAIDGFIPQVTVLAEGLLPKMVDLGTELHEEAYGTPPAGGRGREFDLQDIAVKALPGILRALIIDTAEVLRSEMKSLTYLGPLRTYPARHFAFTQYNDPNWRAGGGAAWDKLRSDGEIRTAVNHWLSDPGRLDSPYELRVRPLYAIEPELWSNYFGPDEIFDLFEKLGFNPDGPDDFDEDEREARLYEFWEKSASALKDYESVSELVLLDRRANIPVSHCDVGVGVSQVLPVIVYAMAAIDSLVAIEQPELHLHPALQAELGDVFIEAALGERRNTFILETHSEHVIFRVLKRIRQTTQGKNDFTPGIRPDEVALLYVGRTPKGSVVQELRIDERGRLLDRCPGGFFEEDFEELF